MLVALEKLFNSSLLLGEEFFTAIAMTDFGSKETTFPLVRAMLVAANLSSPISQDGYSRLLVKSDVGKLKQKGMLEKMHLTEKLAQVELHNVEKSHGGLLDKGNVKALGKFFIRCALWLVKKEGKGREKTTYGSLEAIHEALKEDRSKVGASKVGVGVSTSSVAGHAGEKVLSLEDLRAKKWFKNFVSFFKKDITWCNHHACFAGKQPCSHHCSAKVQLAGCW